MSQASLGPFCSICSKQLGTPMAQLAPPMGRWHDYAWCWADPHQPTRVDPLGLLLRTI
jgi:hypothetical protein